MESALTENVTNLSLNSSHLYPQEVENSDRNRTLQRLYDEYDEYFTCEFKFERANAYPAKLL